MFNHIVNLVKYIIEPKPIQHILHAHFCRNPRKFPIVTEHIPEYRKACIFLAIQRYLDKHKPECKIIGVTGSYATLNQMASPGSIEDYTEGPVNYVDVELPDGKRVSCFDRAILLLHQGFVTFAFSIYNDGDDLTLEVISAEREVSEKFLREIGRLANTHSIYRGSVLSLSSDNDHYGKVKVKFHKIRKVERCDLILPENIIKNIERHTSLFSDKRRVLLERGQHLKRGLLLYGPPGTGKSMTIMYLIGQMSDRTTILLKGRSDVNHLQDACELARLLAPSTLVIDDADIIAEERGSHHRSPALFELLNQMDGVDDDQDLLFILTTNRPEALEPAIAARPGRIDQQILIPLPDSASRLRLFDLYSRDLPLHVREIDKIIEKTEGVSASFMREMLRHAALLALEEGADVHVQDRHLEQAIDSMKYTKSSCSSELVAAAE